MFKKIAIISFSAILLGGCTLREVLQTGTAVKDEKVEASPSPVASPDVELDTMSATTTSTDIDGLEADINSTKILDEDLSNMD